MGATAGMASGAGGTGGLGGSGAGAAGTGGTGGADPECDRAVSVEGDLLVSAGVETDDLVRSVSGDLMIYATIKELGQLRCLESVGGDVRITVGSGASDLEALASLRSVGGALIITDTLFTSISGLRSLSGRIETITLQGNTNLVDLTGLEGLTGTSFLTISNNLAVENIEALSNLEGALSELDISNNAALVTLTGLEGIDGVVTDLVIAGNSALGDLAGLENLSECSGGFQITQNPLLSSCEANDLARRCVPPLPNVVDNGPCD